MEKIAASILRTCSTVGHCNPSCAPWAVRSITSGAKGVPPDRGVVFFGACDRDRSADGRVRGMGIEGRFPCGLRSGLSHARPTCGEGLGWAAPNGYAASLAPWRWGDAKGAAIAACIIARHDHDRHHIEFRGIKILRVAVVKDGSGAMVHFSTSIPKWLSVRKVEVGTIKSIASRTTAADLYVN